MEEKYFITNILIELLRNVPFSIYDWCLLDSLGTTLLGVGLNVAIWTCMRFWRKFLPRTARNI